MASKTSNTHNKYNAYVNEVADLFIEQLEKGCAPWQKGWESQFILPQNAVTGKLYRASNLMLLFAMQCSNGFEDNRWVTFNQARSLGGSVRKGERGVPCIFWRRFEVRDENPEKEGEEIVVKERMIPCPFTIVNVGQCENLKIKPLEVPQHDWTPVEAAEKLLKASGAKIEEKSQSRAFYNPVKDLIVLPERKQFFNAEAFYDTALHELGHWTAHSSRLNRTFGKSFGDEEYAKEELRAEISSFMVGSTLGLSHDPSNHAAYVDSWIKALRDDPREILRACADAEKIKDYLFSLDKSLKLEEGSSSEISKVAEEHSETRKAVKIYKSFSEEEKAVVVQSLAQSLNKPKRSSNPYQMSLFDREVSEKKERAGSGCER